MTAAEPSGSRFLDYFQRDGDTGLTQQQLAQRVGVAEQQIQRLEANAYSGVNLDRLQNIAEALGVNIHETTTYGSAA